MKTMSLAYTQFPVDGGGKGNHKTGQGENSKPLQIHFKRFKKVFGNVLQGRKCLQQFSEGLKEQCDILGNMLTCSVEESNVRRSISLMAVASKHL